MELKDIATRRRATKAFSSKKISKNDLEYIFEITNSAPTSIGLDSWRVIDANSEELKQKIVEGFAESNRERFLSSSDAIIFVSKREKFYTKENKDFRGIVERNLTHWKSSFNAKPSKEDIDSMVEYIESADHGNIISESINRALKYEGSVYFKEDRFYITEWSRRQAYIAAGYTMLAAKEKDIDSLPVEGFSHKLTEILVEENLIDEETEVVTLVILLGYKDTEKVYELGKGQKRPELKERFKVK